MMGSLRDKLTYANLMATVAVFIALGGASYAATQLPKNSIGTKQIKKNAVTTAKIKKEAVTAAKVRKGTLTGTQINASTLGTVPSAANAQTLGGLSADQIAQSSKLRCPAETELASGVCIETAARPFAPYQKALETCARVDRTLPTAGEIAAYLLAKQIKDEQNWTGVFFQDTQFLGGFVVFNGSTISIGSSAIANPLEYRCVIPPAN